MACSQFSKSLVTAGRLHEACLRTAVCTVILAICGTVPTGAQRQAPHLNLDLLLRYSAVKMRQATKFQHRAIAAAKMDTCQRVCRTSCLLPRDRSSSHQHSATIKLLLDLCVLGGWLLPLQVVDTISVLVNGAEVQRIILFCYLPKHLLLHRGPPYICIALRTSSRVSGPVGPFHSTWGRQLVLNILLWMLACQFRQTDCRSLDSTKGAVLAQNNSECNLQHCQQLSHLLVQIQCSCSHGQAQSQIVGCASCQIQILEHVPGGKSTLIIPRCWSSLRHPLHEHRTILNQSLQLIAVMGTQRQLHTSHT